MVNDIIEQITAAGNYPSRHPVPWALKGPRPRGFRSTPVKASATWWLAPPLFDLQVNGIAGVDFQNDQVSSGDLVHACRALHTWGCSDFLLTLITDEWPKLAARLRRLQQLRAQSPELRSAIAGWHIEGPFLSEVAGFHGAHRPDCMLNPLPRHIHELREITKNDRVLMTLAPERPGALEVIRLASSLGFVVSLGHTNASSGVLTRALDRGATGFTHLGNGCPQVLDRHDNILWRVLECGNITISLIPDRIHVSPALFRLAHRLLPKKQICYVSDAMAAAGAPPGSYSIGASVLKVGKDRVVREPGKTNFSGSSLTPLEGVVRAAAMLNCSWQEAWGHFSATPRKFMRLPPPSKTGRGPSFCLIEQLDHSGPGLRCTSYIRGKKYGPVIVHGSPGQR